MILGKNDIGKSNILYAMRIFFNDKKISFDDFKNNGNEDIVLEAHLRRKNGEDAILRKTYSKRDGKIVVKEEIQEISGYSLEEIADLNFTSLKKLAKELGIDKTPDKKPESKEKLEAFHAAVKKKVERIKNGKVWVQKPELLKELEAEFPKIIYIPATYDYESQQRTGSESSIFGKIFRDEIRKKIDARPNSLELIKLIEEDMQKIQSETTAELQPYFSKISDGKELVCQNISLNTLKGFAFEIFIKHLDGNEYPLINHGSGMQRSAIVSVLKYHASLSEKENENTLYLFEEPEAFLHLQAQRELFYDLKTLTEKGSQIVMTTHSTVFMDNADSISNVLLLNKTPQGTVSCQSTNVIEIESELGKIIKISEILTGKIAVFVEGNSDREVFKIFFSKLGMDTDREGIYFIDMGGCSNAEIAVNAKVLRDFNIPYLVILDTDSHTPEKVKKIKKSLESQDKKLEKEKRIIILKGELENYVSHEKLLEVLHLDSELFNEENFKVDPKKELVRIFDISKNSHKIKYQERHAKDAAKFMDKSEIDSEIIAIKEKLSQMLRDFS